MWARLQCNAGTMCRLIPRRSSKHAAGNTVATEAIWEPPWRPKCPSGVRPPALGLGHPWLPPLGIPHVTPLSLADVMSPTGRHPQKFGSARCGRIPPPDIRWANEPPNGGHWGGSSAFLCIGGSVAAAAARARPVSTIPGIGPSAMCAKRAWPMAVHARARPMPPLTSDADLEHIARKCAAPTNHTEAFPLTVAQLLQHHD